MSRPRVLFLSAIAVFCLWTLPRAETPALTEILPASADTAPENVRHRASEILAQWSENPKKAIKKSIAWTKEEKKSTVPFAFEAALQFRRKQYGKTLSLTKKALDRDPHNPDAFYWRGQAYEAIGKPLEAANEYRAALAAQKQFEKAQTALDRTLAQMGIASNSGAASQ